MTRSECGVKEPAAWRLPSSAEPVRPVAEVTQHEQEREHSQAPFLHAVSKGLPAGVPAAAATVACLRWLARHFHGGLKKKGPK